MARARGTTNEAGDLGRRLAAWQAEADSLPERGQRALIWYEIGCARDLAGDVTSATAAWEEARKLDPTFRPALDAAIRARQRRRDDAKALGDLFTAEGRAARSPAEEASASIDQAAVLEDLLGRGKQARPLYERALSAGGTSATSATASLMLELHLRRNGEADAALHAGAARAPHVKDPVLKRLLYGEAALAREIDGGVDEAISFLRTSVKEPIERWRLLGTLEGIARRHGKDDALKDALERMAELAETRGRGEAVSQGLTAGSLPPFASDAHARETAAALLIEIAELAARGVTGGVDAKEACERAITMRPTDLWLLRERMRIAERGGDFAGARDAGEALAKALSGAHAAAVLLHLADLARAVDDPKAEERALERAAELAPRSPAVAAIAQDRILRAKDASERIGWLERRAARPGGGPVHGLWQAAMIAADDLHDARRAQAGFQRALERADDPEPVLREMLGAGLRLPADALVTTAARALVDVTSDERERAHLLFELYRRSRDDESGRALADPATGAWAADVARVSAAFRKDFDALAGSHRSLAMRADDPETAAAHLCAAARALVRSKKPNEAFDLLDEARARVPGHAYALALLEEVLRATGRENEVAALLEEAAGDDTEGAEERDTEPLLLRAAAIAQSTGDAAHAARLLRRAIDRYPKSVAPVERLARLGTKEKDPALEREALEILASRELASGRPGLSQLRLATRLLLDRSEPGRALEALRACFPDDEIGAFAAALLALSPDHEEHEREAIERLLRDARGLGAAALRRRLGILHLAAGRSSEAAALLPRIRETRPDDRWAAWSTLQSGRAPAQRAAEHAAALEQVAAVTSDGGLAVDLLVQARALAGIAAGTAATANETRLTEAILARTGDGALSALVADEIWHAAVDPETRASRLEARLRHASNDHRPQLLGALGRARVAAGRHDEAVPALREALSGDADDLASWEALAIAARESGAHAELVQACDRLATLTTGAPRARLLEESAVALADDLGRKADAETRFREALGYDPTSAIAFRRLHAILDERGDPAAVLDLVTARLAVVGDPSERIALLDEQSRLRHDRGDIEGTVESLRNLQALDPGNAGALALMAECYARLERWPDAVDALRSLSCVDVPAEERRAARVAASRYARDRLGDLEAALADLRVVDGMGLADEGLYVQLAELAERAGRHRDAADALVRAAELATERADRARYERRAAELFVDPLLDSEAAADAYLRVLESAPTDLAAAEGLAALLDAEQRRDVAEAFQRAVRARLTTHPTDAGAIRKLRRSATWCGQRDLELRALDALAALGQASPVEISRWETLRTEIPAQTTGSLAAAKLEPEGWNAALRGAVAAADDAIAAMDRIEPGALGAGRRSLVKPKEDNPVRDAIASLARAVGSGVDKFYVVPEGHGYIEAVPQGGGEPSWVVADSVPPDLSATARFRVASVASAVAAGTSCLLRRSLADAEALVHAIAMASDTTLGDAPPAASDLASPVKKALSRKARKAIADAAKYAAPDAGVVRAFVHAARLASWRAGLVAGGELSTIFDQLPPDAHTDLVRFWLSVEAGAARRELGVALADSAVPDVDTSEATAERASIPAPPGESAEALLERVVAAHPYAPKARAAGGLLVVSSGESIRERVELLLALRDQRAGKARAQLALAAAELLERLAADEEAAAPDDTARAEVLLRSALDDDPSSVLAVRRARAIRAREGAWADVASLLEREAAMPVTPEERAFVLLLASVVAMDALGRAADAESAAKRAFMIRPQSAGLAMWLAETQRTSGHEADALQTVERAASVTSDGAFGAVWLSTAGCEAELSGDGARARRLYRQALRLDVDAVDAAIGLARRSWAEGDAREAAQAAQAVSTALTDTLLREAFLVVAARLLHFIGGQPAEAVRALAGTEYPVAARARVDAAHAQRDRRLLADALRASAEATKRTERALAFVELAEVRAEEKDLEGALEALREAGQADQTLATLRVLREELARRTGDPAKLARATRGAGHGALAAAARLAAVPQAIDTERSLLREESGLPARASMAPSSPGTARASMAPSSPGTARASVAPSSPGTLRAASSPPGAARTSVAPSSPGNTRAGSLPPGAVRAGSLPPGATRSGSLPPGGVRITATGAPTSPGSTAPGATSPGNTLAPPDAPTAPGTAIAATRRDATAAVIGLDAAAEAGDRREASLLMEAQPSGVGASLALADMYLTEDRANDAVAVLRAAHASSPDHAVVRRWLATLVPDGEAAALWLAEAEATEGVSRGFAASMAARLFLRAGARAEAEHAIRRALELAPGHPPTSWLLEDVAEEGGDASGLRDSMAARAEEATDPSAAAEVLIRSALLGDGIDPALLARAHELAPDDPVVADLRLRATADAPHAERAALLARQAQGAPPEWARALLLRAALESEHAESFSDAAHYARTARETAGGRDALAERILDRVEPRAGELDEAAERLLGDATAAPDDLSRALAFERYAQFEAFVRDDLEAAANPLYGLLEQYPAHAASLRLLERIFMTIDDDVRLAEVEQRLATLGHPGDAIAHARLAVRVTRRLPGAEADAADEILRAAYDHVEVDAWLLREVEAMARAAGDSRTLVQVLEEETEHAEAGRARAVAELRLAEAIAAARSPAAALVRLSRTAKEDVAAHPLFAEIVAHHHESAGDLPEAAEGYRAAAATAKSEARKRHLFYVAGRIWHDRIGDPQRAADAFTEIAREQLDYEDVFPRLRRILPTIGESARLADFVERALKDTRGDRARIVDLHLLLAELNQELGDIAGAKKSLRTVATMEPKRSDVLERLARVCQQEEDWRGAIDALQRASRALTEPTELFPVLIELGDLYHRTKNAPKAAATYEQALALRPNDAAVKARLDALRTPRRA